MVLNLVEIIDLNECVVVECVLEYMDFIFGMFFKEVLVDVVFMGLCMNSCIEDFCVFVLII